MTTITINNFEVARISEETIPEAMVSIAAIDNINHWLTNGQIESLASHIVIDDPATVEITYWISDKNNE